MNKTAANNGYASLRLFNYFLRIKATLHSQALPAIFKKTNRLFNVMTRIILILISQLIILTSFGQEANETKKIIADIFLGIEPTWQFPESKSKLVNHSDFKKYLSPEFDTETFISGQVLKHDKYLNPKSSGNQIILSLWTDEKKNKERITFAWYIHFNHEDLAIALNEWQKLKTLFNPQFQNKREYTDRGYHGEQIEGVEFKKGKTQLILKIIKYKDSRHTIEIQYNETRKRT